MLHTQLIRSTDHLKVVKHVTTLLLFCMLKIYQEQSRGNSYQGSITMLCHCYLLAWRWELDTLMNEGWKCEENICHRHSQESFFPIFNWISHQSFQSHVKNRTDWNLILFGWESCTPTLYPDLWVLCFSAFCLRKPWGLCQGLAATSEFDGRSLTIIRVSEVQLTGREAGQHLLAFDVYRHWKRESVDKL